MIKFKSFAIFLSGLLIMTIIGCANSGTTVAVDTISVTGVTVKTSTSILVGSTETLTATITPANATNQNIIWSTVEVLKTPSVATVSETGVVTAYAAGLIRVKATTEDGGFSAYCDVTVTTDPVAVTGISLSPATAALTVGNTQQLTAVFVPANATNQNVTWSTETPSKFTSAAATVSNTGLVTAEAAGSIRIKATSEDGSFAAYCDVTVTAGTIAVTGISLSPATAALAVGNTQQLTAVFVPANATNQNVTWSTEVAAPSKLRSVIASVSDTGLVTAEAEGSIRIKATTEDGGLTAYCDVTVTTTVAVTGISLSPATTTINVGNTQQLTAVFVPANATNQNVTWGFLLPAKTQLVASVNTSGLVTANRVGLIRIKATTEDGGFIGYCDVTVIAATSYSITYYLDGGTNYPLYPTTYTIVTPTITLGTPSKPDADFLGWFSDELFATQVTTIPVGSTGNVTLYAKWFNQPQ